MSIFNFIRKKHNPEWKKADCFAIGGLENIGFAPGTDLLLVLSSQGEGIFDCAEGERIARLHNDSGWWERFNSDTNTLKGFDVLANTEIATCGMYGQDNLKKITSDGWSLNITDAQPDDKPFEKYLVKRIYLVSPDKSRKICAGKDGACELRAFGFSGTEKSFIIALSCQLTIYHRE